MPRRGRASTSTVVECEYKFIKGSKRGEGELHWVPVRPIPKQMTSSGTVLVVILSVFMLQVLNELSHFNFNCK
jgi:hypothetical protein